MHILFVNFTKNIFLKENHPFHDLAPLDIGYCASLLERENHKVNFIDCINLNNINQLIQLVNNIYFDVIVIKSQFFDNFNNSLLEFCEKINSNKRIFLIGPTTSQYSDLFLSNKSLVQAVLINEPEYTLLDLVSCCVQEESFSHVKGIKFFAKGKIISTDKRERIKDLDKLPFPKHSFFINANYHFYYPVNISSKLKIGYILSTRGCPYGCIFCSEIERASFGKEYYRRSAKNITSELSYLKSKRINTIYFEDDLFSIDPLEVRNLCNQILKERVRIKWIVQSRVDILNFNILKLMKKSGCSTICYGIESGSDVILNHVKKNINQQQIKTIINETKKNDIYAVGFLIIGNPNENSKQIDETNRLIKNLNLDFIQMHFFTPYKGSLAYSSYNNNNNFIDKFNISISNTKDIKLKKIQNIFYLRFYLNPTFAIKHIYNHFWFILSNFNHQYTLIKKTILYLFFENKNDR